MPESYENKYRANESCFSSVKMLCMWSEPQAICFHHVSGAHVALGPLTCHRENVVWCQKKVGDPLVPPVQVFCVV